MKDKTALMVMMTFLIINNLVFGIIGMVGLLYGSVGLQVANDYVSDTNMTIAQEKLNNTIEAYSDFEVDAGTYIYIACGYLQIVLVMITIATLLYCAWKMTHFILKQIEKIINKKKGV